MNGLKCSFVITLALTSCISLSHDIGAQLKHAPKTKKQMKIEEHISQQKSDLTFNTASTVIGLVLFATGAKSMQNLTAFDLVQHAIGTALTGGGIYFGLRNAYNLLNLKNKLAACNATQKSS